MHRLISATCLLAFLPVSHAQISAKAPKDLVEFEMMTWVEVKAAIHEQGKTTALVYNGGTEQRGPQNVNGGHNLMDARLCVPSRGVMRTEDWNLRCTRSRVLASRPRWT